MTPELLPCPFCGEHPSYRAYDFQGNLFISVSCAGCDIAFDNADCGEPPPYVRWNRRAKAEYTGSPEDDDREINSTAGPGPGVCL